MDWTTAESSDSVGLILMPTWAYGHGKLAQEEVKMINKITNLGVLNIDHNFVVPFKDQVDTRDGRPMTYPGRIAFPAHVVPDKHTFYMSELRKTSKTPEIAQLRPQNLKMMEDRGEHLSRTLSRGCSWNHQDSMCCFQWLMC